MKNFAMYFSGWHARIGRYEDRWILGGQTILRWQILKKQKQRLQQISSYRMFRPCLCTNNHFQGIEWNTWLYLYRYLLVHICFDFLVARVENYINIEDLLNVFSGSCLSFRSYSSNFTIVTLVWRNFILQRKAFE